MTSGQALKINYKLCVLLQGKGIERSELMFVCDGSLFALQALFNRLLLLEPGNHLIYMTSCSAVNLSADRDAGEKCAIPYLFACYQRAKEEVICFFLYTI